MWLSETEGTKFWMSVLTELQNRGLQDITIACAEGLSGFPDAVNTVYPKAQVQLCIVHMVRNSLKYVSSWDRKAVAADLKDIYQSISEEEAGLNLKAFMEKWDDKYPVIGRAWTCHWEHIIPLFVYPFEIRKIFPSDQAAIPLKRAMFFTDNNEILFRIPRFVSSLSGSLVIVVLFFIFRLINLAAYKSVLLPSAINFTPIFTNLSSGTNHDTTLSLFSAISIYYLVKFIKETKLKYLCLMGLELTLTAGIKMTEWVALIPLLVFICFIKIKKHYTYIRCCFFNIISSGFLDE